MQVVAADRKSRHTAGLLPFSEVTPELLDRLRQLNPLGVSRVVALALTPAAAAGDMPWRLLAAGASDVVAREAPGALTTLAARVERWATVDGLLDGPLVRAQVIGDSPGFVRVLRDVVELAAFSNASVLLLGESGTGKEQIARLVHALDRRAGKQELVVLDCTTVVPELSGSEFFGHERGAFTGAIAQREGAFATAQKGTLFLDEVGELPLALQAQLLRVVQERTYKRIGGNQWFQADFRLVSATNRDLSAQIAQDGFRGDFYHRIASCVFHLPPLRERREDIVPLAEHFARGYLGPGGYAGMDDHVREFLIALPYPGNVRELRQVVGRLCMRHVGPGPLCIGDIPPGDRPPLAAEPGPGELHQATTRALFQGYGLREIGRVARDAAVAAALQAGDNNVQRAAKLLKITDRALQLELAKREV